MDIDEFLDRELSSLGLPVEKTDKPAEISQPNLESTSPIFDSIRDNLGKGSLDQAEQSYIQLWHMLVQQKLKWDKSIYTQLSVLSRQFSSALSLAYSDVKRKSDHINELISRARALLKEGKRDIPFKLYSEVEEISNSIPNVFFEEKKAVQEHIIDFYRELKSVTDNELVKRTFALVQETNSFVDKAGASISRNDITNSIINYNKCIELYNQIPEGFLRHKNPIAIRILDIYKSISIFNEISSLQNQLGGTPYAAGAQQAARAPPPASPESKYAQKYQPLRKASNQHERQQSSQPAQQQPAPAEMPAKPAQKRAMEEAAKQMMLNAKREHAKNNIQKGFYDEADKDIQDALRIVPRDAESKVLRAKIKTLQ